MGDSSFHEVLRCFHGTSYLRIGISCIKSINFLSKLIIRTISLDYAHSVGATLGDTAPSPQAAI